MYEVQQNVNAFMLKSMTSRRVIKETKNTH